MHSSSHRIIGLLSIKITSPVTHMFSSACRSVLQTILGVWIFHDLLTVYVARSITEVTRSSRYSNLRNRVSSIMVILGGSMYYTWVKSQEADRKAAAAARDNTREREVEEGLLMKPTNRNSGEDDGSVTVFEIADSDEERGGSPKRKTRQE